MTDSFLASRPRPQRSYVRPPEPTHFPDSAEMPETGVHLEVRTALYLLVRAAKRIAELEAELRRR